MVKRLVKNSLGPQNLTFGGKLSQNCGKYNLILLANELIQGIAERNVCTKLKKKVKTATCRAQNMRIHNFEKKNTKSYSGDQNLFSFHGSFVRIDEPTM